MEEFCKKVSELMTMLGMDPPKMNEIDGWPKAMKFLELIEKNIGQLKACNEEQKRISNTMVWITQIHDYMRSSAITKIEIPGLSIEMER